MEESNPNKPNCLVALYGRVSTSTLGQDPANQIFNLEEYARKQRWQWETFTDKISSKTGKLIGKRIGLNSLKANLARFDGVLFTSVSRMGRDMADSNTLLKDIVLYGKAQKFCYIFDSDLKIDRTNLTSSRVTSLFGIQSLGAALDNALRSEAMKNFIARRKAMGLPWADKKFTHNGEPLTPIDVTNAVRIKELDTHHVPTNEIAAQLGIGRNRIGRFLKANP